MVGAGRGDVTGLLTHTRLGAAKTTRRGTLPTNHSAKRLWSVIVTETLKCHLAPPFAGFVNLLFAFLGGGFLLGRFFLAGLSFFFPLARLNEWHKVHLPYPHARIYAYFSFIQVLGIGTTRLTPIVMHIAAH